MTRTAYVHDLTTSFTDRISLSSGSMCITCDPYSTEGLDFQASAESSLARGFILAKEGIENYYTAVTSKTIPNEVAIEVRDNLLKPINDYLRLSNISDIKNRVKNITDESVNYLLKDGLFIEIIDYGLINIEKILKQKRVVYELFIFLSKDQEAENIEEIVISIKIKDISFNESISIWEVAEKEIETVLSRTKESMIKMEQYEDVIKLGKIDEKLAVEIKRV